MVWCGVKRESERLREEEVRRGEGGLQVWSKNDDR